METADNEALAWSVRTFIFQFIVARERPPTAAETAAGMNMAEGDARRIFTELDARHAIFLEQGGATIRMASPFSGVPTAFRVHAAGHSYWANCAWDALGIPAALGADARIEATYSDTGEAVTLQVQAGKVVGRGERVHFARPFRQWYDDLVFT